MTVGHVASKGPTNSNNSVGVETMDRENYRSYQQRKIPTLPIQNLPSKNRQAEPSTHTESVSTALQVEESNSHCSKISIKKKPKHGSDSDILYSKFKDMLSDRVEIIDYHKFCNILEELKGKQDSLAVGRSYTNDIGSLIGSTYCLLELYE
ncbi:hypothetical protein QE152_g25119 [Popillia japonica]|uniref:Uncharacterized protein n=1 Tax=Popillia japonica TaxID=7064 RepID=A0AAW1K1M3_POPJA